MQNDDFEYLKTYVALRKKKEENLDKSAGPVFASTCSVFGYLIGGTELSLAATATLALSIYGFYRINKKNNEINAEFAAFEKEFLASKEGRVKE